VKVKDNLVCISEEGKSYIKRLTSDVNSAFEIAASLLVAIPFTIAGIFLFLALYILLR
jgi:hypothetical protein